MGIWFQIEVIKMAVFLIMLNLDNSGNTKSDEPYLLSRKKYKICQVHAPIFKQNYFFYAMHVFFYGDINVTFPAEINKLTIKISLKYILSNANNLLSLSCIFKTVNTLLKIIVEDIAL